MISEPERVHPVGPCTPPVPGTGTSPTHDATSRRAGEPEPEPRRTTASEPTPRSTAGAEPTSRRTTASEPTPRSTAGAEPTPRRTLLRGAALAGGLSLTGTALAACSEPQPGTEEPDDGRFTNDGCDHVRRLGPITGPDITTRFRMEATDLGAPAVTPDGRILFIFGDTFEEAVVGGGFWRSPVGLFADPERSLDDGLQWTGAVGGETAEQLIDYEHSDSAISTYLPGDVITVGETMHVWVMANRGLGNVLHTEIWSSTDSGETWERAAEMFPGDHGDGLFQQCTWCLHPEDGHVYLLTTGFQRDKRAILSRVLPEKLLDTAAYETLQENGSWAAGGTPKTMVDGDVGEMCLRIVDDRWVLTWFNGPDYRVDILGAEEPTAIADAQHITLLHGGAWGEEKNDVVAQLYGPYIVPGSTLDVLHLVCSQWHTGPDWPYHVEQYRFEKPLEDICSS